MRQSNLKSKLSRTFCVAFGVFGGVFVSYQLYSAAVYGTIRQAVRGGAWITFESHPGWFVGSIIACLAFLAIYAALFGYWLFEYRLYGRWRSRKFVDEAIRQRPDDR